MKKILLIGDEKRAPYHPLGRVLPFFTQALDGVGTLDVVTDDYSVLTAEHLKQYDVVISYADCWGKEATRDQCAALLCYVASGGKLFAVHGGTITGQQKDIAQLIGCSFIRHPAACLLDYSFCAEHPIVRDLKAFSVTEEPYFYEWDTLAQPQILMNYAYGTQQKPALWLRSYGWGEVIGFAIGHHPSSFLPIVQQLIYRCVMYLLGRL